MNNRTEERALRRAQRKPSGRPRAPQSGGVRWLARSDIVTDHADVIVIGGGATGIGLLWDLTLRGFSVVLLEQAGLASGTSGAFHGLLHSGARYAGSDAETAAECLAENRILRRIARDFVSDTQGVFVRLEPDDAAWERRWLDGCRRAGIGAKAVPSQALLSSEPYLNRGVASAYRVPDAAIDGFGLLWSMLWSAAAAGARAYFRAQVTGFLTDEMGVRGVSLVGLGQSEAGAIKAVSEPDRPKVETGEITASVVVNATGPWARVTAGLAGRAAAEAVPLEQDKGVMVVFNARLASTVVNRLRPPADGDILVPHGPVTILGTTSGKVGRPGHASPSLAEVGLVMDQGRALVPGLDRVPPLRAYAGVRPLLTAAGSHAGAGRGGGRGFLLVDHGAAGGPAGLVTVAGGKFTTFRAMAQAAGDLAARLMGKKAPCRTAEVGIPRLPQGPPALVAPQPDAPAGAAESGLACECELVDAFRLSSLLEAGLGLADIRRLARVGMGGCQGVFCGTRLAGAMWLAGWPGTRRRPRVDEAAIADETSAFRESRLAGIKPVEWGTQARLGALAGALDHLSLGEDKDR